MLVDKALKKDLERSGLSSKLIKTLGLYVVRGDKLRQELRYKENTRIPQGLKAYAIPYYDEFGEDTGFRRYRMLSTNTNWYEMTPDRVKFGKGSKEYRAAKSYKYNQPAGTEPHLYIPPNIEWPLSNGGLISVPYLLITEGEKKAIKAAACGIHCVAIPGVWNFKSKKRRMALLPEFRKFDFSETRVEVCFDTDAEFNENIRDALFTITGELEQRIHKPVRHVKLPASGDRQALDDYLLQFHTPAKAQQAFFSLEREGDVDKEDALKTLNEEVIYVNSQAKFYGLRNGVYFNRAALMDQYEPLPKLVDPENPSKRVKAPTLWLATRGPETTVDDVTYAPGQPVRFTRSRLKYYNRWREPTLKPNKYSADPWLDHVRYVFREDTEAIEWFLQWLAFPLQNVGAKLNQGVFIYSATHGVGKNFIFQPFIEHIYGQDWNYIGGASLNSSFNGWIADKRFVLIDEFYRSSKWDRNAISSHLKISVTSPTVTVNRKYIEEKAHDNYAQIAMLSNHNDALTLEPSDRRIFVMRAAEKKKPQSYYDKLGKWAANGGAGSVLNHLLRLPIKTYNPAGDAPMNEYKRDIIHFSADDNAVLVDLMLNDPGPFFADKDGKFIGPELRTAGEILTAINRYAERNQMRQLTGGAQSMGSYLAYRNSLIKRTLKLRVPGRDNPSTLHLYAVVNQSEWRTRDDGEWLLHYKKHDERFAPDLENVKEFRK